MCQLCQPSTTAHLQGCEIQGKESFEMSKGSKKEPTDGNNTRKQHPVTDRNQASKQAFKAISI